jgi:hypothetical protein
MITPLRIISSLGVVKASSVRIAADDSLQITLRHVVMTCRDDLPSKDESTEPFHPLSKADNARGRADQSDPGGHTPIGDGLT